MRKINLRKMDKIRVDFDKTNHGFKWTVISGNKEYNCYTDKLQVSDLKIQWLYDYKNLVF
jgi:hypothetical protein